MCHVRNRYFLYSCEVVYCVKRLLSITFRPLVRSTAIRMATGGGVRITKLMIQMITLLSANTITMCSQEVYPPLQEIIMRLDLLIEGTSNTTTFRTAKP